VGARSLEAAQDPSSLRESEVESCAEELTSVDRRHSPAAAEGGQTEPTAVSAQDIAESVALVQEFLAQAVPEIDSSK
jgi:hypothetical protein